MKTEPVRIVKTDPVKILYAEYIPEKEEIEEIADNLDKYTTRWVIAVPGCQKFLTFFEFEKYSPEKLRQAVCNLFSLTNSSKVPYCRVLMCIYPYKRYEYAFMPYPVHEKLVSGDTTSIIHKKVKNVFGYVAVPTVLTDPDCVEMSKCENTVDLFDLANTIQVLNHVDKSYDEHIHRLLSLVRGPAIYMTADETYMCGKWNWKFSRRKSGILYLP